MASGMERDGVAAIWELHIAALAAKEAGKLEVAASLVEVAEAAERLWAVRDGSQPELD